MDFVDGLDAARLLEKPVHGGALRHTDEGKRFDDLAI